MSTKTISVILTGIAAVHVKRDGKNIALPVGPVVEITEGEKADLDDLKDKSGQDYYQIPDATEKVTATVKKGSATVKKANTNGKPEASTDGKPEASTDGKPEASTDGKPEASTDGKPDGSGEL